jgi:hypothetical protein
MAMLALAYAATPAQAVDLFSENFDSLPLGPKVDEALAGAAVWTKAGPAGWSIDDSGVPGAGTASDGVTEWAGWSFADKAWWVEAAGNQNRGQFTNASGTVLVADPDEWDDADHPGGPTNGPWYNTFISTPSISLSGIAENSLTLDFDSSWRPEFDDDYHQTANITVSFDGGAAVEILRWESDSASANFHADATNEHVSLAINNPAGAGSAVFKFGLFDAGNDWWWALDNISVQGVPEPSAFALSLIAGLAGLAFRRRQ